MVDVWNEVIDNADLPTKSIDRLTSLTTGFHYWGITDTCAASSFNFECEHLGAMRALFHGIVDVLLISAVHLDKALTHITTVKKVSIDGTRDGIFAAVCMQLTPDEMHEQGIKIYHGKLTAADFPMLVSPLGFLLTMWSTEYKPASGLSKPFLSKSAETKDNIAVLLKSEPSLQAFHDLLCVDE